MSPVAKNQTTLLELDNYMVKNGFETVFDGDIEGILESESVYYTNTLKNKNTNEVTKKDVIFYFTKIDDKIKIKEYCLY